MRGVQRLGSREPTPKCEQRTAPSSPVDWCKRPRRSAQQSLGPKTFSAGVLRPQVVVASRTFREALNTNRAPENLGNSFWAEEAITPDASSSVKHDCRKSAISLSVPASLFRASSSLMEFLSF